MLRAVRFAARLGFTIEPATAAAIRQHAPKLERISRERIGQEVHGMLTGPRPAQAATMLQDLTLDAPTLQEPHRCVALPTLVALGPNLPYPCALAAWMIDRHLGERVREGEPGSLVPVLRGWRRALCLSNDERDAVKAMLSQFPVALRWDGLSVAQRKRLLAHTIWPQLWLLLRALGQAYGLEEQVSRINQDAVALLSEGVAPPPLITGDDLIAMGMEPGPRFRQILDAVYDEQLEGRLHSREQALQWVSQREM